MNARDPYAATQWTLSDLVDLETLLAGNDDADITPAERRYFLDHIRPQLAPIKNAAERRRVGLRLWLEQRREMAAIPTGHWFGQLLDAAGWIAFLLLAVSGMALVAGLLLGAAQTAHVVIFVGLTLLLPWLVFVVGVTAHASGVGRSGSAIIVRALFRWSAGRHGDKAKQHAVLAALTEAWSTRRVLAAVLAGLTQRGAVGFNLGLILAFVGCLLLFNVRFYWEATPQAGMDMILAAATQAIAAPWSWAWPQAVPGMSDIVAARMLPGMVPAAGDGSWWRFLLMALLIWGLVPRMLLVGLFRHQTRRALTRLDFQAPRHRALWRRLSAVERGEVAIGPVDGVLVLDVGGHGVTGADIRGFLLRRLRVNPLETQPVAVLDEQREAQAAQALAAGPAGVVMLAEKRMLSPRQVESLQAWLRTSLGAGVPVTWLVFALIDGEPVAPAEADMQRWARIIDGLRDPAVEIVAYG